MFSGLVWLHTSVTPKEVRDGLSHTYLIGEKYVDRALAKTGESWGDDASPFISGDRVTLRWAVYRADSTSFYLPPERDRASNDGYGLNGLGTYNFGSAHSAGFNMSMADGSVRTISYDVSEQVHRCLCNRDDRTPVEMPQ
jgi:prepilin-type processing-associated H-X9-DG protein